MMVFVQGISVSIAQFSRSNGRITSFWTWKLVVFVNCISKSFQATRSSMLPCRDGTLRVAFGKKNGCEVTSMLASTRAKVTFKKSVRTQGFLSPFKSWFAWFCPTIKERKLKPLPNMLRSWRHVIFKSIATLHILVKRWQVIHQADAEAKTTQFAV